MQNCKPISIGVENGLKLVKVECPRADQEKSDILYPKAVGYPIFAMLCSRSCMSHAPGLVSIYQSNM